MQNGLAGFPFSFFTVPVFLLLFFFAKIDAGFNASSSLALPAVPLKQVGLGVYGAG